MTTTTTTNNTLILRPHEACDLFDRTTIFAVGGEKDHYTGVSGVLLEKRGEFLYAVATDGRNLIENKIPYKRDTDFGRCVLSVSTIKRLLEEHEGAETIHMEKQVEGEHVYLDISYDASANLRFNGERAAVGTKWFPYQKALPSTEEMKDGIEIDVSILVKNIKEWKKEVRSRGDIWGKQDILVEAKDTDSKITFFEKGGTRDFRLGHMTTTKAMRSCGDTAGLCIHAETLRMMLAGFTKTVSLFRGPSNISKSIDGVYVMSDKVGSATRTVLIMPVPGSSVSLSDEEVQVALEEKAQEEKLAQEEEAEEFKARRAEHATAVSSVGSCTYPQPRFSESGEDMRMPIERAEARDRKTANVAERLTVQNKNARRVAARLDETLEEMEKAWNLLMTAGWHGRDAVSGADRVGEEISLLSMRARRQDSPEVKALGEICIKQCAVVRDLQATIHDLSEATTLLEACKGWLRGNIRDLLDPPKDL